MREERGIETSFVRGQERVSVGFELASQNESTERSDGVLVITSDGSPFLFSARSIACVALFSTKETSPIANIVEESARLSHTTLSDDEGTVFVRVNGG